VWEHRPAYVILFAFPDLTSIGNGLHRDTRKSGGHLRFKMETPGRGRAFPIPAHAYLSACNNKSGFAAIQGAS
jgi:hypothetical protein